MLAVPEKERFSPASRPEEELRKGFFDGSHRCLEDIEKEEVLNALTRNAWIQTRAARELGLTRRQLGYRIKKYKLMSPR